MGSMLDWVEAHKASVNSWTIFLATVCFVFIFLSDHDFSFLLTSSSLVSAFAFFMVAQKIQREASVKGVSMKMFECYLILLSSRLISIIPFEGYLPYDRTGDWLYQLTEAIALCLCGTIVYFGRKRLAATYDDKLDSFPHWLLIVPCLLLALLFHPTLNAFIPADVAWTFALYLEAVASLPQLFYFQRQTKIEGFTSHFLAGQALSKVLSFTFWVATFRELNDPSRALKSFAGGWVIVGQVVQLVIMADFIYLYLKCVSRGVPVQFSLSEDV